MVAGLLERQYCFCPVSTPPQISFILPNNMSPRPKPTSTSPCPCPGAAPAGPPAPPCWPRPWLGAARRAVPSAGPTKGGGATEAARPVPGGGGTQGGGSVSRVQTAPSDPQGGRKGAEGGNAGSHWKGPAHSAEAGRSQVFWSSRLAQSGKQSTDSGWKMTVDGGRYTASLSWTENGATLRHCWTE